MSSPPLIEVRQVHDSDNHSVNEGATPQVPVAGASGEHANAAHADEHQSSSQDAFFDQLSALCGERFEGYSSFPEDPGDDFRDQLLVANFESCNESQIRIPFSVGENRSRTWIITRVEGGLELKHDHRHADGTPDEVTMYGGTTNDDGSIFGQSFPADAHTAQLIPDASTNEWFLSLSEDGKELTYYLERHSNPRFKAVLDRVEPEQTTP